jgi:hypothetical protein
MISLMTGAYTTATQVSTMQKLFWWSCRQNKQQAHFTQVPLLKNLVHTFETMFPYLSVDLVWLLRKSKEGDGFQGWHKEFLLGKQITKTIVINVGSKKRDNEESTRSFNNNVLFEVDDLKEIKEYALSEFNLEDELPQDEQNQQQFQTITHQPNHQQFHIRSHQQNQ